MNEAICLAQGQIWRKLSRAKSRRWKKAPTDHHLK